MYFKLYHRIYDCKKTIGRPAMKKIISFILCVCIVVSGWTYVKPAEVSAASKVETTKKSALKAYQRFLKKYESHFVPEEEVWDKRNTENEKYCSSFAILDMNKDNIPELVTVHWNGYKDSEDHIFTYVNGKIKEVTNKGGIKAVSTAGGNIYSYFCKQNHLHLKYFNGLVGTEDTAYSLSKNGKLSKYLFYSCVWINEISSDSGQCEYLENGKKISSKRYERLYKKCGNEDYSYWKENTSKERKKIV